MKIQGWFEIVVGAALMLLCGCATLPPAVEPWPLGKGMRWTYAGVLIHPTASSIVETNAVRLTCEVLDSQLRRGYLVTRVRNFPLGLSPWEAPPTNSLTILIRTPAGAFHALETSQARPVLARLADAKDPLDDLLSFETQVLAEPLKAGLRWGDPAGMQRLDGFYCWVTGTPRIETLADVSGISKDRKLEVFPVVYQTQPDRIDLQFAPHVGLLASDYVHRGTSAEAHLKLVEFSVPSAGK